MFFPRVKRIQTEKSELKKNEFFREIFEWKLRTEFKRN
ncbi:hypothetical protein LEP1GSC132_1140 [Leptospira kirschneri str. 200803703]|nr:hypothetical protein LEP1GSC044_1083 [Leptospira kirschneri serovar Grippotyphosa str. RM52]EKP05546.1 hypothetical protein LEP1GSC018_3934 [Leptospira kirschneri str. 2008720114]EKQ84716.1 hypothetical protein LEP1GSC064_3121 [Leptospira kirschneri serovar Grippotyphosa str. Moskva]EMJ85446.1 hypothetical protein LEP1GSC198_0068 [Leptospira kirschneri str. JB]EMO68723.1 hypothetical protein LEP1GSC132_1140 [Leptospira kirschneri str. 200803703]EMO80216.1 hypothetical protein LEP1GSC126_331